jgi:hypothetical protein
MKRPCVVFLELVASARLNSPRELTRNHISKLVGLYNVQAYEEIYPYLKEGSLINIETIPDNYKKFFHLTRIMKKIGFICNEKRI